MLANISLAQSLALVFTVLALLAALILAHSKRGKQRILDIKPGKLSDEEGWTIFQWVATQIPKALYVAPAVRLSDAIPSLLPDRDSLLGKFFSLISPYRIIILDAVILDYASGQVVAIVQRKNSPYEKQIRQIMFDASITLIEPSTEKPIRWDRITLSTPPV